MSRNLIISLFLINFGFSFNVKGEVPEENYIFNTMEFVTTPLGGPITIAPNEIKSISLSNSRFIKSIVVQAEGVKADSIVEVMVNGQVKGTIYAPGRDPSYVVTIGEAARNIEFRHREGGSMRIVSVVGTVSQWIGAPRNPHGGFSGSKEEIANLASFTLEQIETLKKLANPADEEMYLFPIKKNAGLVYVMSTAHGNLSRKTINQLMALLDQIDFAKSFLENLMKQEGAFDAVVNLFTVRERIQDMLD